MEAVPLFFSRFVKSLAPRIHKHMLQSPTQFNSKRTAAVKPNTGCLYRLTYQFMFDNIRDYSSAISEVWMVCVDIRKLNLYQVFNLVKHRIDRLLLCFKNKKSLNFKARYLPCHLLVLISCKERQKQLLLYGYEGQEIFEFLTPEE